MKFTLYLAWKYFKPRRSFVSVVTVISILGVVLGVAILIIVISVMNGFDSMWRDKILSFKPHLVIRGLYGGLIETPEMICDSIENIKGVKGVSPVIYTVTLAQFKGNVFTPVVLGIDQGKIGTITKLKEYMECGSLDINGFKAVMGIDLANSLGINLGDKILVYSPRNVLAKDELYFPEEFEISGIFNIGMYDFDSRFIITSIESARALTGLEGYSHAIYVTTDNAFKFDEYKEKVGKVIPYGLIVNTWKDEDRILFAALSHEKSLMFVLLAFITVVAVFCVTNTLIVISVQKTREIGLLKALGFSQWQISAVFILHALLQCIVGTAAGVIIGILALMNLHRLVGWLTSMGMDVFPKSIYRIDQIPWHINKHEMFFIVLTVFVFCIFASLLPALYAARMDPADALRHD